MSDDAAISSKVATPIRRDRTGFSLSALVILVTMLACLLVCVDIERFRQQYVKIASMGVTAVVMVFGGAALIGGFVGIVCLFRSLRGWRMWLLAPIAGAFAGEASLLVLLGPNEMWRTVFAVSVLLVTATLIRLGAD